MAVGMDCNVLTTIIPLLSSTHCIIIDNSFVIVNSSMPKQDIITYMWREVDSQNFTDVIGTIFLPRHVESHSKRTIRGRNYRPHLLI